MWKMYSGVSVLLVALTVQGFFAQVPSEFAEDVNAVISNNTESEESVNATTSGNKHILNYSCHKGRRYYFETHIKRNRNNAEYFCRSTGMELVSVEDCEENTFITNLLKLTNYDMENFWISAYLRGNGWFWNTGERLNYTNWMRGEPNYAPEEYCVQYRYDYMQWNDKNCNDDYYFICESNFPC